MLHHGPHARPQRARTASAGSGILPLTACETARRLVAREAAAGDSPPDPVATVERAVRRLCDALVEWFGPHGTHALLTRALACARADHPALAAVRVGAPAKPAVEGLAESADAHGVLPATAAAIDLLAAVVELLRRLIGDDLATTLVERSAPAVGTGPPTSVSAAAGGSAESRNTGSGTSATTRSTTDD